MPRPARTCSAPDCGRRHFARGYCKLHDARVKRVSHALNMENTRVHERSTTGYRNVYTFRDGFRVQATKRGKAYFGGLYARLEDAVDAAQRLRDALYTHHVEERCRKG